MDERRPRTQIARLFHQLAEPVYFLDSQWRIRFCNRACLEWLACQEEDILDRRCAFHSSAEVEPGDALAAGLCPPPSALERDETVGTVACLDPSGKLRRRFARFIRLHDAHGQPALLAILSSQDLPEDAASPFESGAVATGDRHEDEREALALHERLRLLRQRLTRGLYSPLFLGTSLAAKRLQQQVELAASTSVNVLIIEPPGGGAAELARAIFQASQPVPQQCLVPLPCEELDPDILRNTLQAFEGIVPPSERVHTFILERVHRLPLASQHVLLDYLAAHRRSLRILACTEIPPDVLVRQGQFVEDLAQEISTLEITISPLIERREDIPLMAQAILEGCNMVGPRQVAGFMGSAIEILVQHNWPGNYQELAAVIQAAHQAASGSLISTGDLPRNFRWTMQQRIRGLREPEKISLPAYLAAVEKELLSRALRRARGNKSLAAKMLGISRPKLYRRLVQFGIIAPTED